MPQLATLIVTPYPGAGYGWFSGTSAAAPFVSSAVALMLSVNPALSPEQVRTLLIRTARDLGDPGPDERFGTGLLDVPAVVETAQEAAR